MLQLLFSFLEKENLQYAENKSRTIKINVKDGQITKLHIYKIFHAFLNGK